MTTISSRTPTVNFTAESRIAIGAKTAWTTHWTKNVITAAGLSVTAVPVVAATRVFDPSSYKAAAH